MLIKICGLTDKSEALFLKENNVNFAGMVLFYPKSKRNITIEKAKEIIPNLGKVKSVAVTVSPTVEQAKQITEAGFDYLQIHGTLDEEILNTCDIKVLRAFNVSDMDKYEYYLSFPNIAGFVFDAGEPGSGSTFDWDMLKTINLSKDRIHLLAGGLDANNVAKAIATVNPDGVDVSSGVEYVDKLGKDPDKINKFVAAVRSCEE